MREFPDTLHVRGGAGAGDQILQLATAHAWSARHDCKVDLNIHWSDQSQDWYYSPEDTETVAQRLQYMHDAMHENHRVTIEHFWESDMFSYADCLHDDEEARKRLKPPRYFLESQTPTREKFPFADHWFADWKFVGAPHRRDKTIVYWTSGRNVEPIRHYKDAMDWYLFDYSMHRMFPDHQIIELTYRDPFAKAYRAIQGCDFCVGYDGMWHYVARLFGKHFITCTGDTQLASHCTTPQESAFSLQRDFWKHLESLRNPTTLETMVEYSANCHSKRLANCVNPRHSGYTNQINSYIHLIDSHGEM